MTGSLISCTESYEGQRLSCGSCWPKVNGSSFLCSVATAVPHVSDIVGSDTNVIGRLCQMIRGILEKPLHPCYFIPI